MSRSPKPAVPRSLPPFPGYPTLAKAGLFLCLSGCTSYSSPTSPGDGTGGSGGYSSLAGNVASPYDLSSSGPGGSGGGRGGSGGLSDSGDSSMRSSSGGYSSLTGTTSNPYQGDSGGSYGGGGISSSSKTGDSSPVQDAGVDVAAPATDAQDESRDSASGEVAPAKPDAR
jgi:hypothetical protein